MKTNLKSAARSGGFTNIRVRLGVTQQQLADYLKVSRSLVKMVETNKRSLPVAALLRLANLEIQLEGMKKSLAPAVSKQPLPDPVMQEDYHECRHAMLSMQNRESHCRLESSRLSAKLKAMAADHQKASEWLHVIEAMLTDEAAMAGRAGWWKLQQHTTLAKAEKCSLPAQLLLKQKIALLDAEAEINKGTWESFRRELPR